MANSSAKVDPVMGSYRAYDLAHSVTKGSPDSISSKPRLLASESEAPCPSDGEPAGFEVGTDTGTREELAVNSRTRMGRVGKIRFHDWHGIADFGL